MIKKHIYLFLLLAILLLGGFVRIYKLSDVPKGFFTDEASIGYNAYTILHTGKDQYGNFLPFFFRSFDDYKGSIPIYSTVPLVALFGLNEFTTRIPSALYGVATILIIFFIGKEFKDKKYGLWASFIAATTPWLIHYDRVAFLMNVYATFFSLSFLLFLRSMKNKNYLFPAFFVSGLTLYTYQPAKLIIPLFVIGFSILNFRLIVINKKEFLYGFFIFLITCTAFIVNILHGEGLFRFNQVSILSKHFSFFATIKEVTGHYLFQFSPAYLFFSGEDTFITRHFTQGLLPLLIILFPFLIVGITVLFKNRSNQCNKLIILWLFLYPIGGALVADPPFSSRSIIGAPLCALIAGLGIYSLIQLKKNKYYIFSLTFGSIATVGINFLLFFHFYFYTYPLYSSDFWGWQYGPGEIIQEFIKNENHYDQLFMEPIFNAPDIFFKFYAPTDCTKCLLGVPNQNRSKNTKQLFAISSDYLKTHPLTHLNLKKTIYYPNGSVAFEIGEVVE